MTLDEHETIVTVSRTAELVSIYTSDPRYIRRIRKDDRYTVTREHTVDKGCHLEVVAIDATIPQDRFNALTGAKRRSKPMTPEERQAVSERLRRAREGG